MLENIFRFGLNSNQNECLARGWGQPEPGFVWSEGNAATILLPAQQGEFQIDISTWGYVTASLLKQQVLIFADGLFKGYHEVSQREVLTVVHHCRKDTRALELTFYIPTAISPKQLEDAPDNRRLGIAIATIRLALTRAPNQRPIT